MSVWLKVLAGNIQIVTKSTIEENFSTTPLECKKLDELRKVNLIQICAGFDDDGNTFRIPCRDGVHRRLQGVEAPSTSNVNIDGSAGASPCCNRSSWAGRSHSLPSSLGLTCCRGCIVRLLLQISAEETASRNCTPTLKNHDHHSQESNQHIERTWLSTVPPPALNSLPLHSHKFTNASKTSNHQSNPLMPHSWLDVL